MIPHVPCHCAPTVTSLNSRTLTQRRKGGSGYCEVHGWPCYCAHCSRGRSCFSYSSIDKDLTNTAFIGVEVQGDRQRNCDERLWKKHGKGSFGLPIYIQSSRHFSDGHQRLIRLLENGKWDTYWYTRQLMKVRKSNKAITPDTKGSYQTPANVTWCQHALNWPNDLLCTCFTQTCPSRLNVAKKKKECAMQNWDSTWGLEPTSFCHNLTC